MLKKIKYRRDFLGDEVFRLIDNKNADFLFLAKYLLSFLKIYTSISKINGNFIIKVQKKVTYAYVNERTSTKR